MSSPIGVVHSCALHYFSNVTRQTCHLTNRDLEMLRVNSTVNR